MPDATDNPPPARPAWGVLLGVAAASALAGIAAAYLSKEEFAMALKAADVLTAVKAHNDRQEAKIAALTAERDQLKADADAEQSGLAQIVELADADAPPADVPPADATATPATA